MVISDERGVILGTGGGVVKALPQLGDQPFFHLNSDTMWIDGVRPNLSRLAAMFEPDRMDILMLLAPTTSSIGYTGNGDFAMAADGTLRRRRERVRGAVRLCRRCHHVAGAIRGRAKGRIFPDRHLRSGCGGRTAVRDADGRRLDACRDARCHRRRRRGDSRQRGVST